MVLRDNLTRLIGTGEKS